MKSFLLLAALFFSTLVSAQWTFWVNVRNSEDSATIAGATVSVFYGNTSSQYVKGQTDTGGNVRFSIPLGQRMQVHVMREGYKTGNFSFAETPGHLTVYLTPLAYDGEEVTVAATRGSGLGPATFTLMSKKELAIRNFGQDIPVLLQTTPSVVSTSDAGAGIGYTGIRIRGIDPTRINVTINGVPLNDAESQGVFWVNMPDFGSGVENIQIQRGIGSSTNGPAAFGAGINIKTDRLSEEAYAAVSLSAGSFNTRRQSLKFGTGRLSRGWYSEGRLSWISSDGYIDRASSDLQAWNYTLGHKSEKSFFQVLVFSGKEKTYQAWNGVPMVKFMNDTAGVDSLISDLWYDSSRAAHLRTSSPGTYNYYTYRNETDNYRQSHLQVIYNRSLKNHQSLNLVLHGTLGKGYYENFERQADLANFTDTPVIFNGSPYYYANLVHQRWLDNQFGGLVFSWNRNTVRTDLTIGGAGNVYRGRHFGTVIWHEYINAGWEPFDYYNNRSLKTDANLYFKARHRLTSRISGFADLQVRHVYYEWFGPGSDGVSSMQNTTYTFFNPRLGIQYQPNTYTTAYLMYGRGSHEPIRDDFVNSGKNSRPRPEFMNNIEAAYKSSRGDLSFSVTGYYMGYKDQLAITGKLNDVGGYSRNNIPKSYRAGLELETELIINSWIRWGFNTTLSMNRIRKFTEYVDDYTNGGQVMEEWKNTGLALSPASVMGSLFTVKPAKGWTAILLTKYVGRQFLDNTGTLSRSLDPYLLNDLILQYNPAVKQLKNISIACQVNNLSDVKYASNGYTFSGYIGGRRKDFNFVYPQAGRHYLLKLDLTF